MIQRISLFNRSILTIVHFIISAYIACRSPANALRPANSRHRRGLAGVQNKATIPDITAPVCTTVDSLRPLFKSVDFSGDFCFGVNLGALPIGGISVDGVGVVSFPLGAGSASALKSVAIQAPYGLGSQTIVDKKVRDCFQIDACHVTTTRKWDEAIQSVVARTAEGLGLNSSQVTSKLYKLLLYEPGGHFEPHRDTEKERGMFATLIVQFPSDFAGGDLVVRHRGIDRAFDMGSKDGSRQQDFHSLAFYADCEHELRQITAGHRLVAAYSLCWASDAPPPATPRVDAALALADAFSCFRGQGGLLLEHQYTLSSLARYGLRALKGHDRAIAGALQTASALMAQRGQGGLELTVARAARVTLDDTELWAKDRRPKLQVPVTPPHLPHPPPLPRTDGAR